MYIYTEWRRALDVCENVWTWVSGREEGNPTRSTDVNNLIQRVKKKEVGKQGVSSKVKCAMAQAKLQRMQNILQNHNKNHYIWRYGLYSLTNFHFHLIGRIDDTTQVLIENIWIHDSFPNALKTCLSWSKNVTEDIYTNLFITCLSRIYY